MTRRGNEMDIDSSEVLLNHFTWLEFQESTDVKVDNCFDGILNIVHSSPLEHEAWKCLPFAFCLFLLPSSLLCDSQQYDDQGIILYFAWMMNKRATSDPYKSECLPYYPENYMNHVSTLPAQPPHTIQYHKVPR